MHSHSPDERLIPLSDAAKYAGVTPEHLNLLAREGKLKAQKMGRNWFTSKKWLGEYFDKSRINADQASAEADNTRIHAEIRLRQIEKEERIELARLAEDGKSRRARIQAEVETRLIEKEEKIGLAAASTEKPKNKRTQEQKHIETEVSVYKSLGSSVLKSQEHTPALELLNLLAREIKQLREDLSQEQSQRQAILFAFEHLQEQVREDIERQSAEVYYHLNDRFVNLILEQDVKEEKQQYADEERRQFYKFFIRQFNGIRNRVEELEQQSEQPRAYSPYEQHTKIKRLVQAEHKQNNLTNLTPEKSVKDRKREQIKKRFKQNVIYFKDENFRSESLEIIPFKYPLKSSNQPEYRTVFLSTHRSQRPGHDKQLRVSTVSFDPPKKQKLAQTKKYNIPHTQYQIRPHTSFVLGLLLLIVSFGIMNPNAFSSGNQSTVYSLLFTGKSQLARFGAEQLLFARIGTEELFFARAGRETAEAFITAGKQTPDQIVSTLALFSPRNTIYDPMIYDYEQAAVFIARTRSALDQPLVSESRQPVNVAKSAALGLSKTAAGAINIAAESYKKTLSALSGFFTDGFVAGSSTTTIQHQTTSTE